MVSHTHIKSNRAYQYAFHQFQYQSKLYWSLLPDPPPTYYPGTQHKTQAHSNQIHILKETN